MDPAWIGVVGGIAGGLTVGGFGLLLKWLEIKEQRRCELKAKLEELHFKLELFRTHCQNYLIAAELLPQGKLNPKELTGEIARIIAAMKEPIPYIHTLQRIYAEECAREWVAFMNAATKIYFFGGEYFSSDPKPSGNLKQAQNDLERAIQNFTMRIEDKISGLK